MPGSLRIEELKKKFDENPRRYFAPLANEYRKAGDVAEAIRICRTHLPQQPGHMSGHIVFGQALYESGELDESRQVFEAALALDPENLIALRHLGDIARIHGDPMAARRWYERVLEADPRNEEIAGLIGALPGASADAAAPTDGASGWGDVNPESLETTPSSLDRRETPTYTNAAALLDLEEAPTPEPVQPLAGFEATSAAPDAPVAADAPAPDAPVSEPELVDFPDLAPPAAPSSVTDAPTVAFRAVRPPTPSDFPSIEVEDASPPSLEGASGGNEFDLDAFEAETQYASSGTTGEAPGAGSGSPLAGLPTLDDVDEEPAAPPPAPAPPPRPQRWDRTPLSMEALAAEPLAEAHAASPADGLETMEFVPPPREARATSEFDVEVREVSPEDATPAAFVTETMAELYLQQGFHDEALNVYRQLLAQNPSDQGLRERVWQLEHGARSSLQMAAMVEPTPASTPAVPSAPAEIASLADASPGPDTGWAAAATEAAGAARADGASARAFFSRLASRRAPAWYQPAAHDAPADEAVATDRSGVEATWTENGAGAHGAEPDADALSEADALEPASLDYLAHARQPTPDALPTIADVAAYDAGSPTNRGGEGAAVAAAAFEPASGGSVDTLFGSAEVPSEDERAARTLATVFTTGDLAAIEPPVQGRPTRAAQTEISLDHVFRDGSQKHTPRRSAGFSFDQFFSESAGGTAPVTPAPPSSDAAPPDASGDIEQFNAWLEGLKKK